MRHIRRFAGLQRKGMALLLVMFVAFTSLVLLTALLASVAPRRVSVSGEAQASRVLAVADGMTDNILNQVNALPASLSDTTITQGLANIGAYYTAYPNTTAKMQNVAMEYAMGYLLEGINGGTIYQPTGSTSVDPAAPLGTYASGGTTLQTYSSAGTVSAHSIWDIEDNVTTYLYNIGTQTYYAVWTGMTPADRIAAVTATGINGDITTKWIKNLNLTTGEIVTGGIRNSLDQHFDTDNQWIEIDANAQYVDDGTNGKVQIRTSAYLLSNSSGGSIVKNIVVEVPLKIKATVTTSAGVPASAPFTYAAYSGTQMTMTGATVNGDVFGGSGVTATGGAINGSVETAALQSSSPIHLTGTTGVTGTVYGEQATLPDFQAGTEANVKAVATSGANSGGNLSYTGNSKVFNVNGQTTGTNYYINGNQSITGSGNTIKLYPLANSNGPAVDCYINGGLTVTGNTTIDFGTTPGIIWVNGQASFTGTLTIIGSGTIVADNAVTFTGSTTTTNGGKLAIISEGTGANGGITLTGSTTLSGIFYAPHSSVSITGSGSFLGSFVGGTGVQVTGGSTITYDTTLTSGGSGNTNPILPSVGVSVSFATRTSYRSSWKEAIGVPVTKDNIITIAKSTLTFGSGS